MSVSTVEPEVVDAGTSSTESSSENPSVSLVEQMIRQEAGLDPIVEDQELENSEVEDNAESETDEVTEGVVEGQSQEVAEVDEPTDVLSQVNLDSFTEEDWSRLREKAGSEAAGRIAQLTRRAKEAEEALNTSRQEPKQVLKDTRSEGLNPYNNVGTIEELNQLYNAANDVIDWADEVLENADEYGADDVVSTEHGREWTKRALREEKRKSKKAISTQLPNRAEQLRVEANSENQRKLLAQKLESELSWLDDQESTQAKEYQQAISAPDIVAIKKAFPGVAIEYLIGHAINSFGTAKAPPQQQQAAQGNTPVKVPPTPPRSPSNAAVSSGKPRDKKSASIQNLEKTFEESGSADDLLELFIAKSK
jgi:hypothetical protein